jgi:hypothetical protein
MARLDALEASLATLSAPSVEAPTSGKRQRSPAHERAVRRAWKERRERRSAEACMHMYARRLDSMADERDAFEKVAAERLQQVAHESERRTENAIRARRMLAGGRAKSARINGKRRANALLARQRTREMVAAVNELLEQADKLKSEIETAKQSPTYFDADSGLEKVDLVGRQTHYATVARERAETAEHALAAMKARCERAEEARDKLADAVEGMAGRLAVAEAAVRRLAAA